MPTDDACPKLATCCATLPDEDDRCDCDEVAEGAEADGRARAAERICPTTMP